jgi:hypothetical protein
MGAVMDHTPNGATHLIERLRAGDRQALGELFDRCRDGLRCMVEDLSNVYQHEFRGLQPI